MTTTVERLAGVLLLGGALMASGSAFGDEGSSYDAGGRRDPFSVRLGVQADWESTCLTGGLACAWVDTIQLQGTLKTPSGWRALVAVGGTSYLVSPGTALRDGSVLEVMADGVVLRRVDRDPLAVKPFQDVVKPLALRHARR